ncbi:MAG: T9SS type A sorting domain-containing protein [Saprospiraceae bacterium]|nr:T9SS type A sorting domain-containing protein [Saprospiraceae bacterium]
MKNLLVILLLFIGTSSYGQIIYSQDDLNISGPEIIKISDGGYLLNTYYSSYTPNSSPIEGVNNYKLMKLDSEGNIIWSILNAYFSPLGMFENSDGSFVAINRKFTGDFFVCNWIGYQWGEKIFFTKIDDEGNLLNQFELNPGCENSLRSVLKVSADKYAVVAVYHQVPPGWAGTPPEGHLFFMDDDGNITADHVYPNISFNYADLFLADQNKINLVYINSNENLVLNVYNLSFNLISSTEYPNTGNLFPSSSHIEKIDAYKQLTSNNISLAVFYRIGTNIYLKLLTFDTAFNVIGNYDYPWSRYTSDRLDYEINGNFAIANTVQDNNGNNMIQVNLFAPNGLLLDSTILDIASNAERVSSLTFDHENEILIGGSFNCCNLNASVGPAKSFLSFGHNFITTSEEQEFPEKIQIFPNPTIGNLQIESSNSKIVRIDIYDKLGRIAFSSVDQNGMQSIDISELSAGMYFVVLKDGDGNNSVKKVVLE